MPLGGAVRAVLAAVDVAPATTPGEKGTSAFLVDARAKLRDGLQRELACTSAGGQATVAVAALGLEAGQRQRPPCGQLGLAEPRMDALGPDAVQAGDVGARYSSPLSSRPNTP